MQTWSVGILCYNEAGSLEPLVVKLIEVLRRICTTYEVIIVDDFSTDGSREIAIECSKKYPGVRTELHERNQGIGAALLTVYTKSVYENVCVIPGDGQFDVEEYLQFPTVPENHFVSFYRKENTSYSLFRNALSLFNKKLNKTFIGIDLKDVNWTKIFKKADLAQLDLQLTSSLVESEICAKLIFLGKKVIESESKYLPRKYGESRGASFAIVIKALKDTWHLVAIMRNFKRMKKAAARS